MKKVVFFVDYEWALGSIHYELCKRLWEHGIDCQVLPWHRVYNSLEIQELSASIDLWVTLPQGWDALKSYGITSPEKVVLVSHAVVDLHKIRDKIPVNEFLGFRKLSVVSNFLQQKAIELNIKRYFHVTPVGVNTERFKCDPSLSLKTVGYGGMFINRRDSKIPPKGEELEPRFRKRSYLAEEAANQAGLRFIAASSYHTTQVAMASYYRMVDCIIIPSMEEGAGLPALEAGASGRLVIGTNVGHWSDRIGQDGGIMAPLDEEAFMPFVVNMLKFYKEEPVEYQKRCWEILNHAKHYDWNHCIDEWVKLME